MLPIGVSPPGDAWIHGYFADTWYFRYTDNGYLVLLVYGYRILGTFGIHGLSTDTIGIHASHGTQHCLSGALLTAYP